ncbi:preprotein translocase subunit SecE [Parachlamydia sp. AcF125]|uniref:preprotein translocase subunit SecE n=1 Tax=Parachlamydia sp. AcF125 TaxID=2795736 RepID=UPI001BCA45C0|nr:preprotein translocase subunit SecE [Parachlamydia sp. AcF125]MBS4168863.1 Protein translocase subunit SecE [Parachlamydia sp. AcF125]
MEVKKTQQVSEVSPKESSVTTKKDFGFLENIKAEFQKITWTSQEELLAYAKIVVGATFAFGIGIYIMDVFIQTILAGLGNVVHLIAG